MLLGQYFDKNVHTYAYTTYKGGNIMAENKSERLHIRITPSAKVKIEKMANEHTKGNINKFIDMAINSYIEYLESEE